MLKHLFFRFLRPLLKRQPVLYINGPDTLPPPLSQQEEEKAIAALPDVRARDLLVEHNLRLTVFIAKRFENTGINIEDLISIGTIGLMKAVSSFDVSKRIKLATYASRCIENEILMYIRKNNARRGDVSIDEPLHVDWDGNKLLLGDVLGTDPDMLCRRLEDAEERKLMRKAIAGLSPRERTIIDLRFGLQGEKEMTQKEVADLLGISQSYISRLEKKIILRLKKELTG